MLLTPTSVRMPALWLGQPRCNAYEIAVWLPTSSLRVAYDVAASHLYPCILSHSVPDRFVATLMFVPRMPFASLRVARDTAAFYFHSHICTVF